MQVRFLPLTVARTRHSYLKVATTAFAVTFASLSLLAFQGITYSTSNLLVSYSLNNLPHGEENITINSSQAIASPEKYSSIDSYLTKNLQGISAGSLAREVIYTQLSDPHGIRFYLGAGDGLSSSIKVTSGRLPSSCSADNCEVIQIGRSAGGVPRPEAFKLHIVGTGEITDPLLFSGTMGPAAGSSLLLADGIRSVQNLPTFANSHAADAWVGKIDLGAVNAHGADAYIAKVVAFEDQLSIDYPDLIVTWPQDALSQASSDATSFKDKTILLKFAIVTLLLGYLAIVSFRQRKDHQRFRESLSRIGTPKAVINQELFLESLLPVTGGVLIGLVLSPLLPSLLKAFSYRTGYSQLFAGSASLLSVALAAFALIFAITVIGDRAWQRERTVFFILAAASFAGYLYFTHSNDSRYLLLPFVYLGVPVLGVLLGLRLITSWWAKRKRQTFVILKEFFSLWHGVGATIALATLLAMATLSFGSGVSAQAIASAHDLVPLDVALKTGSDLIKPLDLAGVDGYSGLIAGSRAFGVLRTGTSARGASAVSDSISLIGTDPQAVSSLIPGWGNFTKSLAFAGSSKSYGLPLGKAKVLTVELAGIPPEIDASAWFINSQGEHQSLTFAGTGLSRTISLRNQLSANSTLVAFEFAESSNYLSRRLHANGEGDYSVPQIKGVGSITSLKFDGVAQVLPSTAWGNQNFAYDFDGQSLYIQPKRDGGIPSVIVDPATAALAYNGLLTLSGAKNTYFQVKVGKVVSHFPSAGDRFVVMSLNQMQSELGAADLGSIDPIEVWVSTPDSDGYVKKLESGGFGGLVIQSSKALESEFRSNPNDQGILSAYKIALLFALFVALLVTLSALPLVYREGRQTLFYLETVGSTPGELRSGLRSSLRLASLAGLLLGGILGIVVGRVYISSSLPILEQVILLFVVLGSVEAIGFLFTRRLFTEDELVRSS